MRILLARTGTVALAASLALMTAGCGGSDTVEDPTLNEIDANLMFEEPANDASALESVVEMPEPTPDNVVDTETNTLGETSGGDTGGNTVDSNVSGM